MNKRKIWSIAFTIAAVACPLRPSALRGQSPANPTFPKELTSYREIVKQVLPAVVGVESEIKGSPQRQRSSARQPFSAPGVPEEFRKFFEEFQSPFDFGEEIPPQRGFASGFVVDPSGVVLTNYHVVKNADRVTVELPGGRKLVAKDIRSDPQTDLAILRIDANNLPYLAFGNSDEMEIGDRVLAVGAPFGLIGSVTSGIVSAKRPNLQIAMYGDYLQTDAAINPGNSGGPLVNLEGKVVGVNTAITTRTGGWQGVGLAIAGNFVKEIWPQLLHKGHVVRGYLGVSVQNLNPDIAARLEIPNARGVLVTQVFENSPAAKAGLKEGDVIVSIAGKAAIDGLEIQRIILGFAVGQMIDLDVMRDRTRYRLHARIAEQPLTFGVAAPQRQRQEENREGLLLDTVGIEVADLTPEWARELGYAETTEGAFVTRVIPGSLAEAAGVQSGSLVLKVDQQPVKTAASARDAIQKGSLERGILLQLKTHRAGVTFVLLKASKSN